MKKTRLLFAVLAVAATIGVCSGCTSPMTQINNFAITGNTEMSSYEPLDTVSGSKTYKFLQRCQKIDEGVVELTVGGTDDKPVYIKSGSSEYMSFLDNNNKATAATLKVGDDIYYIRVTTNEFVKGDQTLTSSGFIDGVLNDFSSMKLVKTEDDGSEIFSIRDELVNNSTDESVIKERIRAIVTDNSCRIEQTSNDDTYMIYTIRDVTDADKKLLDIDNYKPYEISSDENSNESKAESKAESSTEVSQKIENTIFTENKGESDEGSGETQSNSDAE